VLLAGVLPLGLIGLWLTRDAQRSGEALLRNQLDAVLIRLDDAVQRRWVYRRSDLLLLTANEPVQSALREGGSAVADSAALVYLRQAYATMQLAIEQIRYRDVASRTRWALATDPAQVTRIASNEDSIGPRIVPATSILAIDVPISDEKGTVLGTLTADVRTRSLLPSEPTRGAPDPTVLALFNRMTGESLLPTPFDPELLRSVHFEWEGQQWLAVRRTLTEPALELVIASPLEPFVETFESTARRGALLLTLVGVTATLVAFILARRLTRSLERLVVAAEAVSGGDLDRHDIVARSAALTAHDEVSRLASAFDSMTDRLRRSLEELTQRRALGAVGDFAAELAHEVRNPLTTIRIDLQRLEEKLPNDPRLREPLADVLDAVNNLNQTVTGALRIARSGRIEVESVHLADTLAAARRSAEPEYVRREAMLEPLPDEVRNIRIRGDSAALGQLFLNLFINAAQSLEPGGRAGVIVKINADSVTVTVWDRGCGMSAQTLQRIFEPFFTTRSEGTGLGLAIAKRIATAHGGDVRVDSIPDVGTQVHVTLPV
jgi:signal transduction histidine kinase